MMSDHILPNAAASPVFALNAPLPLGQAPSPAAERAKVGELAQQFEAMLMLNMVRQMRQSLLDESEEPQGFGAATMRETFDAEFSRYLAQSGGVGLGAYMMRTLDERASGAGPSGAAPAGPLSFALPGMAAPSATALAGPLSLALPPIAAASAATRGVGRSTDTPDAPASVELPLPTSVTSAYGWRSDPFTGEARFHRGVDLRAAYGTEVPAASAGTVVSAGERGTYGTLVVVRDDLGVETRYAHLSATLVKEGDVIAAGTPIGRVGSSGRSAAPHLHFEVLVNGERVDPAQWAGRVGRGPLKSNDVAVD
jgi:murein DD-endopeptidase MepM/ murein hydrolase activator NlpD